MITKSRGWVMRVEERIDASDGPRAMGVKEKVDQVHHRPSVGGQEMNETFPAP